MLKLNQSPSTSGSSERPRLLLLTHRFPYPPNRGDRIRSYNLLKQLSRRYSVTLGAVSHESTTARQRKHVESFCEQVILDEIGPLNYPSAIAHSFVNGQSVTASAFKSTRLAREVLRLQQQQPFDVVLIFCSGMFQYVEHSHFAKSRLVVDLVDVDSEKWHQLARKSGFVKRCLYRRESKLVARLENKLSEQAAAVTLVSQDEVELFRKMIPAASATRVHAISNGVDLDYFRPARMPNALDQPSGNHPFRLLFTGVLDYAPNVKGLEWFCHEILPVVRDKIHVSLDIVGRTPNGTVQGLGELPGVNVHANVPDMRPWFEQADVAISPLQVARGIQNKLLEGMAMACPLVATSVSANGIGGDNDVHFKLADTPEQWENALLDLYRAPNKRQEMAINSRQWVEKSWSWSERLQPFFKVLSAPERESVHV